MHHGDDFRELWRRKVLVFLTFSLERDNSCRLGVSVVHVAHGSFFRCVPASQAEKSCAAPSIGHQRDEAILHIDSFGCDNQFKPKFANDRLPQIPRGLTENRHHLFRGGNLRNNVYEKV
jgi:hypothetical protein